MERVGGKGSLNVVVKFVCSGAVVKLAIKPAVMLLLVNAYITSGSVEATIAICATNSLFSTDEVMATVALEAVETGSVETNDTAKLTS